MRNKVIYVIIATNNGGMTLLDCIESLACANAKVTVIIVDNGTTDSLSLMFLGHTVFQVDKNPDNGYDTGAYLYAIDNYLNEADYFLFCHDDVIFKPGFDKVLLEDIKGYDVLAMSTFIGIWDAPRQKRICEQITGIKDERHGIFGPIFFASSNIIKKAKRKGLLWFVPKNKIEQQAMERGWGYIFSAVDAKIKAMVPWPGEALNEKNHDYVIQHRLQKKQ